MVDYERLRCLTDSSLMARLLWGEAEGEGVLGMLAVAHTVLNRAARPRWWGHDVQSVILCPGQYHGLQRVPETADYSAYIEAKAVALLALGDHTIDPTQGATHFHTINLPRPWALPEVARIGGHIFYRE